MRLAVVTAVLLLVCILDTVTARWGYNRNRSLCRRYPKKDCGGGWSSIAGNRCAKFFWARKTHDQAEKHCQRMSKTGNLVSIHNIEDMNSVLCLTYRSSRRRRSFWFGLKNAAGRQRRWVYTDGTRSGRYTRWYRGEPSNSGGRENCAESNFKNWGYWNDADCSSRKYFVCAKKK